MAWTEEEIAFLVENYPKQGKNWCAEKLGKTEHQIRSKAHRLGLKQDRTSDFFKDWQARAAKSKVGKPNPNASEPLKRAWAEGRMYREYTEEQKKKTSERVKKWIAENGHPKGFLGGKHTEESLKIISKKSKAYWENVTEEQLSERAWKQLKTREANGTMCVPRKASWKGKWHEIGGVRKYYRSKWESNYAYYLQWLKENGKIKSWAHEPKTFWFEGIKRGCVSYLPDFLVIQNDGADEYHEVKGWMDGKSITKIKRMAKFHPDVKLIVIDSKAYKSLKASVESIVPGWEA